MTKLPTAEDIIAINTGTINKTGGSIGLRDAGALAMCAEKPKTAFGGNEIYKSVFDKAAASLESIARNHPFIDGNKRTAFMTALRILESNGYRTSFDNNDIEKTVIRIVVEKTAHENIAAWLKKHSRKIRG